MGSASPARWAAVLGHELRNPLAAAMTGAAVMRELLDPGDPRIDVAEGVLRDLGRLSRLVDSYLELARGRHPRRETVDLNALCQRVAKGRPSAVAVDLATAVVTQGDSQLLQRCIENLVDNALQAGARRITLRTATGNGKARVCVDDDGPGIPAEMRDHLFEPGYSGRGSTGLGLCIVAEVIAAHGGAVECERLDAGSRFLVDLPARGTTTAESRGLCAVGA